MIERTPRAGRYYFVLNVDEGGPEPLGLRGEPRAMGSDE